MDISCLEQLLQHQPRYRLNQAYEAVYKNFVESWEGATNLPKAIRTTLQHECPLGITAKVVESPGGETTKAAILLEDGCLIESVLMHHRGERNTVCVSTQAGCNLGCDYCATGKLGFKRNLSAMEIVSQVVFFERMLKKVDQRVSNVVFMGMGEPFLNYADVMTAIRVVNDEDKLCIGARHISVSTVGIVEGIDKFANEGLQVNLSLSLNAPDDALRNRLMPINKKYPIEEILKALSRYIEKTNRRVMIGYIILKDVNDSQEQAAQLTGLLKRSLGRLFFVNLISYNPTGKYGTSPLERIQNFKKILESAGIGVTQRYRFGKDIEAACGQLVGKLRSIRKGDPGSNLHSSLTPKISPEDSKPIELS